MKTLILSERGTFYLDKMRQCFQCKAKPNPQLAWKQVMPLWFHQQSKGQQKQKKQNRESWETKHFHKDHESCIEWLFQQKRRELSMKYLCQLSLILAYSIMK